jgi:hypothetical protein
MITNNHTLRSGILGITIIIAILSAGCLWHASQQSQPASAINQTVEKEFPGTEITRNSSQELKNITGGLNPAGSPCTANGAVMPAPLPVVRGLQYVFTDTFPADPTIREVRLWVFSSDSVFTIIAPVRGGTTMSEKKLKFVFDENQTARLPAGSARVILERPSEENRYALSINQENGNVLVHESGSESFVFNCHEVALNKSGAAAADALSHAISRATPRLPAREEILQVDDPYIIIENPGDLPAGYPFSIHGSTNLGSDAEIVATIGSSSFTPCPKSGCNRPSLSQEIQVSGWPGTEKNWTVRDRMSEKLPADEYLVEVTSTGTGAKNTTLFTIRSPFITIDPVSDHSVRDPFNVTGTTNIPAGETIFVEMADTSFFGPCHLNPHGNVSSHSGSVPVMAGMNTSPNTWKFSCDISSFDASDEYLVSARSFATAAYSDLFRIFR